MVGEADAKQVRVEKFGSVGSQLCSISQTHAFCEPQFSYLLDGKIFSIYVHD